MRIVLGPKPGELRKYIPKAFGNDKDERPVTVWIKNPTERKKREIFAKGTRAKIGLGSDGRPVLGADGRPSVLEIDTGRTVLQQDELISACVDKVENYTGPGGTEINDGKSLADHGEREIVQEVADEIAFWMSLKEDDRKNSDAPQPFRQGLPVSSTAVNASSSDYTDQEIVKGTPQA